ncbi:serine protease [Jannaschia aquimarina]|uniref:Putative peptidoglycan binding domain protein n=1 Tax=Jannaschia aquimarina TaxID=935700 RepID=A0A0D1EHP2_9RHOB|nr:serine protease [Jannaschia aquimarina]KIT17194.1 putative peptidoglycan binding domain protein [Jannaschia aquimarina]SNT18195.1 Sporulation related domain-containing protein [Jannaschia aquimarina]
MRVLTFLAAVAAAPMALAENYVQIEAHRSLTEAQERAQAYEGILPNVNGFELSRRWYALAIGPYATEAEAAAALRRLRSEGLIPRDSYTAKEQAYRDQFWPTGARAAAPAIPITPALPEAQSGNATGPASDNGALILLSEPDETPREARRSEQLLTRLEREDLQRALQWFGFYTARIDGAFGRGTRRSMGEWQDAKGYEVTGILTTRQRSELLDDLRTSQAALGLEPLRLDRAGIALTAPLGLVSYDRIEAPFVHYQPKDGSGVRLSLISQPGDAGRLAGLYEILQTLDIVPPEGERGKLRDSFRITGQEDGRTTQVFARLEDGHILGYILSWPPEQAALASRALPIMQETLASVGRPLDPEAGFDPAAQSFDMVSGLEVRKPLRSASGFFVNPQGAVVTAAKTVAGCGRITLDRLHEAQVAVDRDGVAVLTPLARIAPVEVATLAPGEGRLRSDVSVGGYPFGGVLGAATLSFGTLEDVRGLDGSPDVLRLSLESKDGDAGGPVLDGAGRVTGMLLPAPDEGARALPGDVAFAVKARSILTVLGEAGIPATEAQPTPTLAPEDLSRRAAGLTVLVSCWE